MKKQLLACGFALCAPLVIAPAQAVEIISHLNDMDIVVEPLGVPPSNATDNSPDLIGVRAVKVINRTGQAATCEFHIADEDRVTTASTPIFSVSPNSQAIQRVPGDYSPDKPYAELTCKPTSK